MTAEKKVDSILAMLSGLDPLDMTTTELDIWEVVGEREATHEERTRAEANSETLVNNI